MKYIKRIIRVFLLIFMLVLVLLLTINFPVVVFNTQTTENDYANWMSETLNNEQLIIDVAMLGAHDAFTSDMNLFSKVDVLSADSIQTGITGLLIKGFSYKQSITQVSSVSDLLQNGVRYFDIRLTYNDETEQWMTSHTYFSTPFESVLTDLNTFLVEHPGEFVILDIQHVNGVDYEDLSTFLEIKELFNDSGVLDFAYSETNKPLNQITYGDITNNKAQAGVIILSKYNEEDPLFFSYLQSIRSNWANTDNVQSLFDFLNTEASLITNGEALTGNQVSDNDEAVNSLEAFRVMQGVLTMQLSGDGIIEALIQWSLLERAKDVNTNLIESPDFLVWLEAMPICMVDYADSNNSGFLDKIMEKIIYFNEN